MQFRLVKTGKRYSESPDDHRTTVGGNVAGGGQETVIAPTDQHDIALAENKSIRPAVVWRGTADEYLRLLVLREAELVVAKTQLTGNERIDWYVKNRILDLEIKISDLKKWLAEVQAKP